MSSRTVEVDYGRIFVIDSDGNKVGILQDEADVYRFAVDAKFNSENIYQGILAPFTHPPFKLKTASNIIFSNSAFVSIYNRSGSGIIHKVHFKCDTQDFFIRVLADGEYFINDISTDFIKTALPEGPGNSDHGNTHTTFLSVDSFGQENITMDFSPAGLKYLTSFQILLKRDSSSSSNKTMEALMLWEIEL